MADTPGGVGRSHAKRSETTLSSWFEAPSVTRECSTRKYARRDRHVLFKGESYIRVGRLVTEHVFETLDLQGGDFVAPDSGQAFVDTSERIV